jgi:hypothetical protein
MKEIGKAEAYEMPSAICVQREKAASLLGMSVDSFKRHVAPEIEVIIVGRLRLYVVAQLVTWAEQRARPILR